MIDLELKNTMRKNVLESSAMAAFLEDKIQEIETQFKKANTLGRITILRDLLEIDPSGRMAGRVVTLLEFEEDVSWIQDDIIKGLVSGYVYTVEDNEAHLAAAYNDRECATDMRAVFHTFLVYNERPLAELADMFNDSSFRDIVHNAAVGRIDSTWWAKFHD